MTIDADVAYPADQAARHAIATDLTGSLLVEAGAGTGKTTSLIERVVSLVASGVPLRQVAAITFTEAAAAELRERLRDRLTAAEEAEIVPAGTTLQLDEAAVCTLHAFAQRLLAQFPVEAALPPGFEVLDEVDAELDHQQRWARFLDELYERPDMERTLLRSMALGLNPARLRELADKFADHYDRLGTPLDAPGEGPIDPSPVIAALRAGAAWADHGPADDKLTKHLTSCGGVGFATLADQLAAAHTDGDELEVLRILTSHDKLSCKDGRKDNWGEPLDAARASTVAVQDAWDALLSQARTEVCLRLAEAVRRFTLDAAAGRRADGRLVFHDLLVAARDLVLGNEPVRRQLAERWPRLLIDEFQDTDPLQLQIAEALGGEHLFFVGDAKQSIYRFRRADPAAFGSVRDALERQPIALTTNFRSVPAILAWVNDIFAELLGDDAGEPLTAHRASLEAAGATSSPAVRLVGEANDQPISEVRAREAADVARTAMAAVTEGWPVATDDRSLRPATFRDVAILLPTRTSLASLEDALTDHGVPYVIESASLVWDTQPVRDVLAVLRAIDDPADAISVVAALKSTALGCSDDDLLAHDQAGGRWWPSRNATPEALADDHPVAAGLAAIHGLSRQRWSLSLSGLVAEVTRALPFFPVALAGASPRDRWRRLRFVVEQSRAYEGRSGATLRGFLEWASRQASASARINEPVLPEDDHQAVRILTIHGAKGREFPITILSGLNVTPTNADPVQVFVDADPVQLRLGAAFPTPGFQQARAEGRDADEAERRRLLYVAATRARDHVVVSVHRSARAGPTAAHLIAQTCERHPDHWQPYSPPEATKPSSERPSPALPDADYLAEREAWSLGRDAALAIGRRAPVVAATAVASATGGHPPGELSGDQLPIDDKPEPDTDGARWRRGRGGTSLGRAVHATLQTVDLADPSALAEVAAAQAAAEGIVDRTDEVTRLAANALNTQVVTAARALRHWRELYVASPMDDATAVGGEGVIADDGEGTTGGDEGVIIEGFVDLLYEDGDGLVVVDYKTDALRTEAELDAAEVRYRPQLAAYAVALEQATGRSVDRAVLLFLNGDRARVRWAQDFAAAKAALPGLARTALAGATASPPGGG